MLCCVGGVCGQDFRGCVQDLGASPDPPLPDPPLPPLDPSPLRPKFRFFFFFLSRRGFGAAGASHDSPRTPNVHISGPPRFKHHQNSTRPTREGEKNENCGGRVKKKREILGPTPFGAQHPSGPTTLRCTTLRGPKIQHPKIGRTRKKSWPKSKLAEVDRARWRAGRHQLSEGEKNAVSFPPLILEHFWPASTLLRGPIALATLSLPETDPQILGHRGYADEDHLGKSFQAMDFGLEC